MNQMEIGFRGRSEGPRAVISVQRDSVLIHSDSVAEMSGTMIGLLLVACIPLHYKLSQAIEALRGLT
jgi:hypothetical protein